MPEAYYIIPMVSGPYSRENTRRPDYVDEIKCNWTGHNVDALGVYICKVNTSEAKHTDLASRTGVRQLPRDYTWDTVISTMPGSARNAISAWCTSKGIAYDATDTIGQFLMRIIQDGIFTLGAVVQATQYQNLTVDQKNRIAIWCTVHNVSIPAATETVRAMTRRLGSAVWPGNDLKVTEF